MRYYYSTICAESAEYKGDCIMKVRVMTFNIRYDTKEDGIHCFDGRKENIKKFIEREQPDVIGFQEVLPHVRKWLVDNLADYVVLGMGRNPDYTGESVSIAYRKEKYNLVKFDQFWLSDTPDVPGSRYTIDQSGCPRISVIASLVSRENGKVFTFANTHLDHVGKFAQVCGASLLMTKLLSENKYPFFLTGDFNATPESEAIKTITNQPGIKELTEGVPDTAATYHGYGTLKEGYKIDYIFTNKETKLAENSLTVHEDCVDGIYLSDHYPISVIAEIE